MGWGSGISLVGKAGRDGISVLTGSGAPSGTAAEGTPYVDTSAGQLYTYTSGSWVAGKSLVGPMGLSGLNAQLLHGANPPTTSTFNNQSDALYLQTSGEVWFFDFEGTKTWTDSGQSLVGPQGPQGTAGQSVRGSQIYEGSGPPPSDTSGFTPPPAARDIYFDTTNSAYYIFS